MNYKFLALCYTMLTDFSSGVDIKEVLNRLETEIPEIGNSAERGRTITVNGISVTEARLERWSNLIIPKTQAEDALVKNHLRSKNPFLRYICSNAILKSRGVNVLLSDKFNLLSSVEEVESKNFKLFVLNIEHLLEKERAK